ncbi:MAG: sugar phosphate isomerase/epimerase [Chloroflexi bacterium]|nr:sugar phosphate isomerase/epimerase [Chloroflexota bacterium]
MAVIIGSLAGQNWHRQVRQRGFAGREAFYYAFDKTVAAGKKFGFSPMGIDFGVHSLGWASARDLDELRGKIRDSGLFPMVGFGPVAVHYDIEVRRDSLAQIRKNLELVKTFGCQVSNFGCARNGRITREGQIAIAIAMLREVGKMAADLGLRICQEDFDWWRSDELIRISVETGLDNVGIQSDTGNWLILGENPVDATRRCMPWTYHAHVRDYLLEGGTYNGVAVGAGLVDFERILPMLAEAGRERDFVFSMEVDTDDRDEDQCADDSYAYLKAWCVANGHTKYVGA